MLISCSREVQQQNSTAEPTLNESPNQKIINNINKYWPEGTYVQYFDNEKYIYVERWIKNEKVYLMEGCYIQLQPFMDTLFRMWGKLYFKDEIIKMIYSTSMNKNEIEFVLSKNQDNEFVFENPFQGFPSIMKYNFVTDSTYEVLERGFLNGVEKETLYKVKLLK
ncbi:MAG: hypothetical protein N3F09_07880 [Bacteroidia bacterium]|nr:hypothetical protein [Bacteroidia bacterium]